MEKSKGTKRMKILHLDIETSPNVAYIWGLFDRVIPIDRIIASGYTLCWAAKWDKQKKIMFSGRGEATEEEMLSRIWDLLNEADVVVHYNGLKFDIPTLNREFSRIGVRPPDPYHQVDLLRVVKKRFRFTSNKLDWVCQQLDLGAKEQHKGMSLWTGCMEGDKRSWKQMKTYNIQDVVLLEKLYHRLLPWIQDHPNHHLYAKTDRPVCTNCGSPNVVKKGTETTKTMKYQRYRCTDCGTPLRGRFSILSKEDRENVLTQSKL